MRYPSRLVHREHRLHGPAGSIRRWSRSNPTTKHAHSLRQARQAPARAYPARRPCDPWFSSVVAHVDLHSFLGRTETDHRRGSQARVTEHVGERLLHHTIDCEFLTSVTELLHIEIKCQVEAGIPKPLNELWDVGNSRLRCKFSSIFTRTL